MNKKMLPFVVGIPNMGVGLLWAMNTTLIPMLVATVTTSNFQLGALTSMGALTGIFVQYFAGLLSDRSHFKMGKRKPFMLIGVICAAIFMCMMPFSKNYVMMFITGFLFYFSLNFYQGPYYSFIPEAVSDDQLGLANGFSKIISVLGCAVVFIVCPILWDKGHYLPFIFASMLGLASVVVTALLVKEEQRTETAPSVKFSFSFVKNRSVMRLCLSVFFIYMSYGAVTSYFTKYVTTAIRLPAAVASNGLLVAALTGAIFAAPMGILSDKIERRRVLMIGTLIFGVAMSIATMLKSAMPLYITLAFVGVGFISIQVTSYSILAEIAPPECMGEYMGILNLFISLGQFVIVMPMGFMLDKLGYSVLFPVGAGIMFVAFFIILFSRFERYGVNMTPEEHCEESQFTPSN